MKIFEKIKEHLPFKKMNENSTNKKNKKQEKKKSKLKTFINVLAYIFGGIFLIILLFSCVNSCKGNNNNENNKKVLNELVFKSSDIPSVRSTGSLTDTTWRFNNPINWSDLSRTGNFSINFRFKSNEITWGQILFNTNNQTISYYLYPNSTLIYSNGSFVNNNYRYVTFLESEDTSANNYRQTILDIIAVDVTNGEEPEVPSIEPSTEPSITPSIDGTQELTSEYNIIDTIVFNNAYDWRILFSGGYQKNTGLFFLNRDYAIANPVVHFTGMEFVVNGVLYNTIDIGLIVCDNASVVYTGYDNEGKQIEYVVNTNDLFSYNNDKSLCAISRVYYRYYEGSVDSLQNVTNSVHVYNGTQINYVAPSSQGGSTYVESINYNIHEWLSNDYKKLSIVSASTEGANSLYPNISTYELITNNENLVITEYGELGDVFTLLGGGFSALTSVFGIYVLPNISIGVLIFLPLVVVMFITIIRLIKK